MKKTRFYGLVLVLALFFSGCKKEEKQIIPDYATAVSGLYSGYFMFSGIKVQGTTKITKSSNNTVNLDLTISNQPIPTSPGIAVSDGGNGISKLRLDEGDDYLEGTVENKKLTYSLVNTSTTILFEGYRP